MPPHAADSATLPERDPVPAPRPEHAALRAIADAAHRALATRHPSVDAAVIEAVVYQAAGELVCTQRTPAAFAQLLHRRANARLLAMTGVFTPVQCHRR